MRISSKCPVCESLLLVEGQVGYEDLSGREFFPRGIKFFTRRRSVPLVRGDVFRACTECGHVWNTLDAGGLRELIEAAGTDELKARVAARKIPR